MNMIFIRQWKAHFQRFKQTNFGGSVVEIGTIWILSNVPIALLLFVKLITTEPEQFELLRAVRQIDKEFVPAEVFVYICVILAPILWMMGADWRARTHYRLFVFLGVIQFLILGLTGVVYALHKTGIGLNEPVIEMFASGAYVAVIAVWFATIYFRKSVLDHLEPLYEDESAREIANKLKEHDHER